MSLSVYLTQSIQLIKRITQLDIKSIRKDIWEAIAGTEQDFTKGSMKRAVFLLSVPMVLEMMMESIFAVVDIYFVSKLGADAVATVGITESLTTIVYSLGGGLAMATTALISRRIGEQKPQEASKIAFQAIITGILASFLISVPGIIWGPDILGLMGASEVMVNEMSVYTRIILGTNGIIMLLFIINAILRSSGDAAMSLRVLWLANICNIILDPLLILGIGPFPELGIKGAAIATSIGRGIAVVFQFYLLFRGKRRIKLTKNEIAFHPKTILQIIKLALGGIGQSLIATTSWIGLIRIVAQFGSFVVAGYTIAIRVLIFALLPSWGISNAAATLVGQNLGAKKPDRAEKAVWMTGWINTLILITFGIILVSFPDVFIRIFVKDEAIIQPGVDALRIISFGFLVYGLGMVMVQSFNGAGDTGTPAVINFICFWLIEIPLAYVLAIPLNMKETGVFWSIVIAETIMTIIALILFRRGRWKLRKV